MFGSLLKAGAILSEKNRKEFLGILLAFFPLNIGMDARNPPFLGILNSFAKLQPNIGMDAWNPPFLGILNSFAKLQPNVGILSEQEFRIPRTIQRMNQT